MMSELHPALLPSLAIIPADRPVALLTRHSIREVPANGIATYDLPLTPAGVRLAEAWGAQLGRPVSSLHSSPVERCVDTALAMARGAGLGLEVMPSMVLVEPGCFVSNPRHVAGLFLELGPVAFANRHFRESLAGVLSPREGCAKLLRHLHGAQGQAGSLAIHVTHDTILAAFVYHLIGQEHLHEDDWPWMMEGVWVWFEENRTVCWLWRGRFGRRDLGPYLG